jgi:hypothetical protein
MQLKHTFVPVLFVWMYISVFYAPFSDDTAMEAPKDELQLDSIPICERKYCPSHVGRTALFAIKSPAQATAIAHRNLIRSTFVAQIGQFPQANHTFYLSRPDAESFPRIQEEITHFRDITILNHVREAKQEAIKAKTQAFFRHATRSGAQRYSWICHVDDDSYVQVYRLMHRYLLHPHYLPFRTLIGRRRDEPDWRGEAFAYPGGQMFCLTWDLATAYGQWFDAVMPEYNGTDYEAWPADDLLAGLFLYRSGLAYRFVSLDNRLAFDIGDSTDPDAYAHAPNPRDGINAHKMKAEGRYAEVAAAFEQTYIQ